MISLNHSPATRIFCQFLASYLKLTEPSSRIRTQGKRIRARAIKTLSLTYLFIQPIIISILLTSQSNLFTLSCFIISLFMVYLSFRLSKGDRIALSSYLFLIQHHLMYIGMMIQSGSSYIGVLIEVTAFLLSPIVLSFDRSFLFLSCSIIYTSSISHILANTTTPCYTANLLIIVYILSTGWSAASFQMSWSMKKSLRTLETRKENYKSMTENIPVPVLKIDRFGNILFKNTYAQNNIKSYDTIYDLIDEEYHKPLNESIQMSLISGKPESIQVKSNKDNGDRTLLLLHVPILSSKNHIHNRSQHRRNSWCSIIASANELDSNQKGQHISSRDKIKMCIIDVTDKNREHNLLRAKEYAERLSYDRYRFLANVSHELRTPLTVILGIVELMNQEGLSVEQQDMLHIIQSSADTAVNLVNDLLDVQRLEEGKYQLQHVPYDPFKVIQRIIDILSVQARQKNVMLGVYLSNNIPHVVGDPRSFHRLVMNLLSNAIKFTNNEGSIIINADIVNRNGSDGIYVDVTDTGIGIKDDHISKLFAPFYQADPSNTSYHGTGLGLSICKQLCDVMGGEIGVSSKVGSGSTFWFWIPLEPHFVQSPRRNFDFQNEKVMISDFHPLVTKILENYLKEWNGRVTDSIRDCQWLLVPQSSVQSLNGIKVVKLSNPIHRESMLHFLNKEKENNQPNSYKRSMKLIDNKYRGLKVLLVEDNTLNQRIAQRYLQFGGLMCDVANNGKEAVDKCSNDKYDIILMDCHMPVMDGLTATRLIRDMEKSRNDSCHGNNSNHRSVIIAATANIIIDDENKCQESGMDSYISKPFSQSDLIEKIESTLDKMKYL